MTSDNSYVYEPIDLDKRLKELKKPPLLEVPKMLDFHEWLDLKRLIGASCRVIGETRTGKTINCLAYSHKHNTQKELPGEPPIMSVIHWKCRENLTTSGLFTGLLKYLKYQAVRGRNPELRDRLYRVLESCQVEMLILDEAHRAYATTMSEIRDIADALEISVVLVGTDRLNAVLEQDEQVDVRFEPCYRFARLNADEVRVMTAMWEEHVLRMPEPSNLTSAKAQKLIYPATRGYIGVLSQVLVTAAIMAIHQSQSHISLEILTRAIKERAKS
jgi:DNA transposition AAA+ family ATPase